MKSSIVYIIILSCFLQSLLHAQILPDQVWLHGIHETPGAPGIGNSVLTFSGGALFIEVKDLDMNFECTMAVMPDTAGKILFYTNGCYIANAAGDTMLNGVHLNPGEIHDRVCPSSGYISPMGAMVLQQPGYPNLFYLFHMGVRYLPERTITYGPLYYTIVDMSMDNGNGAVISANNIVADGKLEPLSAVRHGNGRDWWLVFPEYGTNRYHILLFSKAGIQSYDIQSLGDALQCRYVGSTAFSPDGSRYARQQHCGVEVLDFDRCSGVFSQALKLNMPPNAFGGGGVAFNKDGSRIFVTTQLSILSADLEENNPVLDTIVTTNELAGVSLHLMQYGADGKIYVGNMSRAKFLHIINQPDAEDIDFRFKWHDLANFNVRTLPNIPNYRLGPIPNSVCDSLVGATYAAVDIGSLQFWPNPVEGILYFQTSQEVDAIQVMDASGRIVINKKQHGNQLVVSDLPPGFYLLHLMTEKGVISRKFVKKQ